MIHTRDLGQHRCPFGHIRAKIILKTLGRLRLWAGLFLVLGHHRASSKIINIAPRLQRLTLRGNAMLWAFPTAISPCYDTAMTDITHLEEKIAHLTRTVEDLSDIIAAQQKAIDLSTRRLAMLMEREAGREMDAGGTIPLADQRPPHW